MDQHYAEGTEIGKVVADGRLEEADICNYINDILELARADSTLSEEARALAQMDSPFSVADGSNMLIVEGTLTYTFVIAVAKGAGAAAGGLAVKELWGYVKNRLHHRDPVGIKDVDGGTPEGSSTEKT